MSAAPLAAIFGLAGPALTEAERAFFSRVRPAGYILFARNIENPEQVIALIADLRGLDPAYKVMVLIDQEGGRVQRLKPPYWRHAPAAGEFGPLYGRDPGRASAMIRLNMHLIGIELAALGIDVDCAPVMDVPVPGAHDIIGDRAYSPKPDEVAVMAGAACQGLMDAGVVPVIKHIPGHGRALSDSHLELPVVNDDLDALRANDFAPFKQLCGRPDLGTVFAMTAHVVYRAIDPSAPATTSETVIGDIIRGEIGFDGVLMSDDLGMKALTGGFDERTAACRAAGCDLALHCDGNLADMEAVASAAGPVDAAVYEVLKRPRGEARAKIERVAAAEFTIINALRHG